MILRGVLVWLLCSGSAAGATIYNAAVRHQGGSFIVEVDALLDVTEHRVRAVLTDYNHLERISPAIESSEILSIHAPGKYRLHAVTQTCLWYYCKHLKRVADVVEARDGSITAVVVPPLSDFSHGNMRVKLWQEVAGTRLLLRSEMTPDVWIPPLLGPWLVLRALRNDAMQTMYNLERVAAETAHGDSGRNP